MPFPVTCPACGKSFSISDEVYEQKIKGRIVSVKCKQCQGAIRVDGTKGSTSARPVAPTGTAAPPAPAPATAPATAPQEPAAPPAQPAAAPPPAQPAAAPPPAQPAAAAPVPAPASAPAAVAETKPLPPEPAAAPAAPLPAPAPARAASPSTLKQGSNKATLPMGFGAGNKAKSAFGTAARPAAAASPKPPEAKPTEARAPEAKPTEARAPEPVAALPPQETAPLFAVDAGEGGDRELTAEQIGREIASGSITADTLVWRDGMAEWLEVKKVPELAAYLKKPEAPKQAGPRAPAPVAPPGAATPGAGAGRFRPRQPTLPMGALPTPSVSLQRGELSRASANEIRAKLGEPRGSATKGAPGESKHATTPEAPPVLAQPPAESPVPGDDEPTVLRSPDAVAKLLSAVETDDSTPVPPRLAAQLGSQRGSSPGLPPLPARTRSPLASTPDSGAGGRSGADRVTPPPPLPFSTQPASERRPGSGKLTPIDTFRESPEAKRAWFPEPVPAPAPSAKEASPPPPLPRSSSGASPPPMPVQVTPPPMPAPAQPAPPALLFEESLPPVAARTPPLPSAPSSANPLFAAATAPPSAVGASPVAFPGSSLGTPPAFSAPTAARPRTDEDVAFRPKRGKGWWIVLLVLALLAAGGAAFYVLRGPGKRVTEPPKPAPAALAAAPVSESPPAAAPESPPAAAPESPPADPGTSAASGPGESTTPEAPPPGGAVAPAPAEPTGSAQPGGTFADLFAAGAKQASGGRFDPKVAKAAVDKLLPDAARCREPGGPTGYVRVDVTFNPAGTVSNAVVADAPIAGTSTAACISAAFKRATIPAFSGTPGSVSTRISIQ